MNILAVDWTAVGSVAAGFAAIAAFLAILATIAVYLFQTRANKAAEIRQNLQFIHSLQTQVTRSIKSGHLAMINRQIREFQKRLGHAAPSYFLDQLFGNGQSPSDRSLFRASALDTNMSSMMYSRMDDIWNGMNMKALELRGALGVFSYVCLVLTAEARDLCSPDTTVRILDNMADKDRDALSKIDSLDVLVNELLSSQIELASRQSAVEQQRIKHGCSFIAKLTDTILCRSNSDLLKLARMKVRQPGLENLENAPCQAIQTSLGYLQGTLPGPDYKNLRKQLVECWAPGELALTPQNPYRPETSPSRPQG
jgi:hypothetical protein